MGQPVPRREDKRFITGTGRYVDDIAAHGSAHAVVVRSPHAHANVRSVDISAAQPAAGVLAPIYALLEGLFLGGISAIF